MIAHSPLGGPRAGRRAHALAASRCTARLAEVALAWLLELSPAVVAIPGARRPETARSAARAATLELTDRERARPRRTRVRPARRAPAPAMATSSLVMGIPGAGKSRVAEEYVARGYVRLNRDERGGSLRDIAAALDEQLASGMRRVVLDNTYLTRASRSYVIEAAGRHGVAARCIWLDTPLAQAQVNLVERLLERFGSLPTPEELRRAGDSSRACSRRPRRCERSASWSRRPTTRASPASSRSRSNARAAARGARRRVRAPQPPPSTGRRRLTPQLRTSSSTGARTARRRRSPTSSASSRPGSPGPWRARSARIRAARRRLLVPAAAAGAATRVRAGTRHRSGALDAHRRERRPPDAGDDPRRPLRPCLTGDRLELVHDLGERPSGVDLNRRPGP